MKICFLIRSLGRAGAERQLIITAGGLSQKGHYVSIITYHHAEDVYPLEPGINHIHLPRGPVWGLPKFIANLKMHLINSRYDIIITYLDVPNIAVAITNYLGMCTPNIWQFRVADLNYCKKYHLTPRMLLAAERILSKVPVAIVTNAAASVDFYSNRGFPREKFRVIPNGIDTGYFYPDPDGARLIRDSLRIPSGHWVIGRVGRLDYQKDYVTFLQAAALFLRKCPNSRFLCVGDGPQSQTHHLQKIAVRLHLDHAIQWLGSRHDMRQIYSAFDIACSSSLSEGFPNAVAEAMACGVPNVVTPAGDSALVVGDTGFTVPFQNPQAMADAWFDILRLGPKSLGLLARERIVRNFSVTRLISDTEQLLWAIQ